VDYANAVGAFIADLLAAVERDQSEGWLRCSLKKEAYTDQYVTWRMFDSVRTAWLEAALLEHKPGYPGVYSLGNPGPSIGKLTRYRATPSLLSLCETHGVTPATVRSNFGSKMRCHPSWCSSPHHGEKHRTRTRCSGFGQRSPTSTLFSRSTR